MSDRIAIMDRGRIVQIGSPAEIYEHPRTEFVATFIGESNLFAGEGGRQVSVRPERMSIAPDGGSFPAGLTAREGTVEEVIYQGEMLRVLVRLAPEQRCTVALRNDGSLPRPLPWASGDAVLVGWDPADARMLER